MDLVFVFALSALLSFHVSLPILGWLWGLWEKEDANGGC
jgi:hypothetical protein